LRIAIIAPPWVAVPPLAYGGTEAVIDGLARALQSAGHEVLLFATGDSTCPVPSSWVFAAAVGVDAARPATELHHVVNAYDWIAGEADVVHDHTLVGPVYAQRFATVPVVTTNHGPFDGELGDYYRAIAPCVPIIAISRHQASTAVRTPVAAVIHHGVDVARFPVGNGEGGYALFLGRMSPDKGVHTAIAVARAAGVPLKIACKMQEPAEQAYYRAEVAPLLGDDVQFVGEVGGDEKLDLLAGARCLLNPIAWHEPFGMVMIEAMACGTPVVATPMGAVNEIIHDGVTGFVRATPGDLAVAVIAAGQLDRLACRQVAAERFSTARMAADHVRLYESVAGARRAPARVA
jgi:glycosyltransferase involved in cell wall biosynthesis